MSKQYNNHGPFRVELTEEQIAEFASVRNKIENAVKNNKKATYEEAKAQCENFKNYGKKK